MYSYSNQAKETSVKHFFSEKSKFRIIENDSTFTRLDSLQQYLRKLKTHNEISEEVCKRIRRKNARLAKAHGTPKIHKAFVHLPNFRPIIDTAGSTHYHIGQYLTKILQPLIINDYNKKDSFDAGNPIKNIPKELFGEGYRFVSFDVESLFINIPLHRSINVILTRIYHDKLIHTGIKKNTMHKLMKVNCKKTAFSFENIIDKQIDGVIMG